MPDPTVILDTIDRARFREWIGGVQVIRGVVVKNIDFDPGESGARIWAKALLAPGFPAMTSLLSPDYPVYLQERQLEGINRFKRVVRGQLIYGSPTPTEGGGIPWSLTGQTMTNHIHTFCTAGGNRNLFTWYKKDGTTAPHAIPPAGSRNYHFGADKIVTFDVIRATGFATKAQWAAVKPSLKPASGTLNAIDWGTGPTAGRGYWLFLGPLTRTLDRGNSFTIQLDFISHPQGWFPLGFYFDVLGRHPKDAATEAEMRVLGFPPVGEFYQANGATLASVYEETNWPGLLSFTPDDT